MGVTGLGRCLPGHQKMLKKSLRRIQEISRDQEMFRVPVRDLLDPISVHIDKGRLRVAKNDGRVCRNQKVRMPRFGQIVDDS